MAEEILTDTTNPLIPSGQSASIYKIQLLAAICLFFFFSYLIWIMEVGKLLNACTCFGRNSGETSLHQDSACTIRNHTWQRSELVFLFLGINKKTANFYKKTLAINELIGNTFKYCLHSVSCLVSIGHSRNRNTGCSIAKRCL